jgi:hypothetical protein
LPTLTDDVVKQRERAHVEGHIRSLDQQTLDALLRIEELLQTLNEQFALLAQRRNEASAEAEKPTPAPKRK